MSPSDSECIQSCLDDHPEAFRHLVQRYQAPLARYLRGRLENAEDVVEAVQEAFVRAYFALPKLRKPEAFLSWLVGIAERVARETRRSATRRRPLDPDQEEPSAPDAFRGSWAEGATTEAVSTLPDAYREVIVLRYYGGHSCAEISRRLGVPLGTVTKRLSRAYALLRERLRGVISVARNEVQR